jgi:hypothetical protein
MKIGQKFLFLILVLTGLSFGSSVYAASGSCPTDNGLGLVCSGSTPYYCTARGGCSANSQCVSWSGTVCSSVVEAANACPASCNSADSCGYCNGCTTGKSLCGSYPSQTCKDNVVVPTGCSSYSQCSNVCSACSAGFSLVSGSCVAATLKLGSSSVSGSSVVQGGADSHLFISGSFASIGTSTAISTLYSNGLIKMNNSTITQPEDVINKSYLESTLTAYSSANSLWQLSGNNLFASSSAWSVGIGTSTPADKLHILSTGDTYINLMSGVGLDSGLKMTQGTGYGFNIYSDDTGTGAKGLKIDRVSGGVSTNALFIDTSRNVGIGTTTPAAALDIFSKVKITSGGTIYNTDNSRYLDMSGTLTDSLKVSGDIYTTAGLFKSDAAGSNYMLGNLGIGTTTPQNKLSVVGNGVSIFDSSEISKLILSGTGGSSGDMADYYGTSLRFGVGRDVVASGQASVGFAARNGNGLVNFIGTDYNSNLGFYVGSNTNQFLTINQTGNIGIGTTNPGELLSLSGSNPQVSFYNTGDSTKSYFGTYPNLVQFSYNRRVSDGGISNVNLPSSFINIGGSSGNGFISFETTNTNGGQPSEIMRIAGSGRVGIGTTGPDAKLNVNGTFHVTGALNSVTLDKLTGTGNRIVMTDASGSLYATSSSIATGLPTGTSGQTLRSDGTNWLANSVLYNDGTNIGIGTTNLSEKLQVVGNIALTGIVYSSKITIDPSSGTGWYRIASGNNSGGTVYVNASIDNKTQKLEFNYNMRSYIGTNNDLGVISVLRTFSYNSGPISKIRLTGNSVAGDYNVYLDVYVNSATAPVSFTLYGTNGASFLGSAVYNPIDSTYVQTVDLNDIAFSGLATSRNLEVGGNSYLLGNVGIGTTSPAAALDIFSKVKLTSGGTIYNTDNSRYLDMTGILSDSLKISGNIYTTAGLFKSDAAGSNYMLGNLGIGTTNPVSSLHLQVNTTNNVDILTLQNIGSWAGGELHNIAWKDSATTNNVAAIGAKYDPSTAGVDILFNSLYSSGYMSTTSVPFIIKGRSGSVGIGTTAPSSKLTIYNGDLEMSHNTSIKISSSTINTTLLFGNYADSLGFYYGTSTQATNKTVSVAVEGDVKANRLCIQEDCKSAWSEIVTAGGGNQWITSGNNIYNSNSGNIGIGTNNPLSKLSVNDSSSGVAWNGVLRNTVHQGTAGPGVGLKFQLGGNDTVSELMKWSGISGVTESGWENLVGIAFNTYNGSDNNERMRITNTGFVGIGTSTPLANLQIGSQSSLSTSAPITLSLGGTFSSATGTNAKLKLYDSGGSIYGLGVSSNQFDFMIPTGAHYSWNINGAEKVRIDSTGNVGIGDTNPIGNALSVVGNIAGNNSLKISSSTAANWISGNTGIGNASNGASKLAVFGNASIGSSYFNDAAPSDGLIISGKVGIGTNNPAVTSILDVNGLIKMRVASTSITQAEDVVNKDYVDTLIQKATSSISSFAQFVGKTTATSTGLLSATNGYAAANALCSGTTGLSGSHVCTSEEILYTINSGHGNNLPTGVFMWINNGPPGFTSLSNDCLGWTYNGSDGFGAVWVKKASNTYGTLNGCDKSNYFACCK